jgi:Ca2+-transporting ATPase
MKKLNTSIEGLDREEAERRLTQYGFNELKEVKKKSSIMLFLDQFKNYLMLILMAAVVASAIISEYIDALVILIIMIMCVTLGFVQEHRAEKAMEALKRLAAPKARVRRSGEEIEIPAREIVPGDVVLLKTGDRIPADARVVLSMNLKVNEASLTGESVPVEKSVEALSGEKIGVAERANMVYMSTTVIYGRGEAVVTATGMNTEFGRIAEMIQTAEEPPTPLEKRLEYIGKWLGLICVVVCAVVVLLGIFRGHPPSNCLF